MSEPKDKAGYKRPPVASQFKKGRSGNPKGRPKGTRNFKTDLKETLARPVQINDGGRSRSISTQQASLERLREKALKGDQRALDSLLDLAERHAEEETALLAEKALSASEAEILADYDARLREALRQEIEAEMAAASAALTPEADGQPQSQPSPKSDDEEQKP